jgi:hypothetical protein
MSEAQSMNRSQFHKSWLLVTAIVIGAFGPVFKPQAASRRRRPSHPAERDGTGKNAALLGARMP